MPIKVQKELYPDAKWIANWLGYRSNQLRQNMKDYFHSFYQKSQPIPLNVISEYNRQIRNLGTLKAEQKNPKEKYFEAVYYPTTHTINYKNDEDLIHEETHGLKYPYIYSPQEYSIEKYNKKYKEPYWDKASEIYARLMQFRKENNIGPTQQWTKQQIKNLRNNENIKDFDLLKRYDDDFLLFLFNDIAQNNQQSNQNLYYAKFGRKLIKRKRYIK